MSSSSPSSKRNAHGVDGGVGGGSSSSTIARGPAIQRLIVVGPTMGGKRTFVDRLRSSSEATNLSKGQLDGSPPRRLHGRQPREQPQPYKTLHGPHHGCSMHFTSIAYHYNLDASKKAMLGAAAGGAPSAPVASSSSAADETASVLLNNTVMEVLVCDTPETLLQAMPTDPDQLLHSTAVVIALSATEVYSVSADVGAWTTAINDAVNSVVTKHNNRVAAAKKHAQQQHGGGAASRRGGAAAPITDSTSSLTTFDIRRLSEARASESEVEQEAFGGDIKGAFLQASRSNKDWAEPSLNKEGAGASTTAAPMFPDSGKCLLPTLVLLSKMDVLEEICKKPQHAAGSGSPLSAFQAAVQHSRWQALQRGAAFAAISNKGFSNAMSAVFDALWRYIAFALFPQRRVQEHLKLIRRQERKKQALTTGRRGGGHGGGSDGESDDEANRQEEDDARREIDDAVAAARQQRAEEDGTDAAAGGGGLEDSTIGQSPAATTTTGGAGSNNQEQSVNHLKSVLSSSTVKTSLNAVASQTIFIPKGLDDPAWLYRESFAARWLHMYNVFKLICSTDAASAVSDDSVAAASSPIINKHAGKARLESFSKEMAEALGAATGGGGGASQMPASSPTTAFAPSASSPNAAAPASTSSPTTTAPAADTTGQGRTDGGAATTTAEDEELVWDSI